MTVKHLGGAIIDNHAANIVRIFQPDNGMNEDIVNVPTTSLAKKNFGLNTTALVGYTPMLTTR